MNRLSDKTAIVTGGASGIGLGIAHCFADAGARVAVADMNFPEARRVPGLLKGDGHIAIEVDVTSDESVANMVTRTLEGFGDVDILVNNAGMSGEIGDPFPQNTSTNWLQVLDTNLVSMERTVVALWNHFTERRSGNIINIASIVAHNRGDMPMKPAYNVSKCGVISLTHTLAVQLAAYDVRVNSISPGILYTAFWKKLGEQLKRERPDDYPEDTDTYDVFMQRVRELVPLQRPQLTEDIGRAAAFLASDDARNITGIDLPVDGGVLAR